MKSQNLCHVVDLKNSFVTSWKNVLFTLENIWTCSKITWNYFPCLVLLKVKVFIFMRRFVAVITGYWGSDLYPVVDLFPASRENTAMPSKNNPNTSGYFHAYFIPCLIALLITQSAHREYSSVNDINDTVVISVIYTHNFGKFGRSSESSFGQTGN